MFIHRCIASGMFFGRLFVPLQGPSNEPSYCSDMHYEYSIHIALLCFRYVGNLDSTVTEDLLVTLFSKIGHCMGCKIIREVSYTSPVILSCVLAVYF